MKKRIMALLLSVVMVFGMLPAQALAANGSEGTSAALGSVHVIVENTRYAKADGAPWDGVLVDEWVELNSSSTMMTCIVAALDKNGFTQSGAESNYISAINGLEAFDGGFMSGWMGTLNDWFTNEGFAAFTVANGKLEANDEIRIMYTTEGYGEDLGGSWSNNSTDLKDITFSNGELDKDFSASVTSYTLNVAADVDTIKVTPTAENKNFQVHTYVGETLYKRTQEIPVEDGTVIKVKVGEGPSMNGTVTPNEYTFTVKKQLAPEGTIAAEFDKDSIIVNEGEAISLQLNQLFEDGSKTPLAGATILVDGKESTNVTDEDGEVTFTISEKGSHTIGAVVKESNMKTTAECTVEVVTVIATGTALNVAYTITSDGVCYIEKIEGTNGQMGYGSTWSTYAWNAPANNVSKIIIKEGVTKIGSSAFYNTQATEVQIPGTVTYIASNAFYKAQKIKNLVIPEGVTTIDSGAFEDFVAESLSLPSTLKSKPSYGSIFGGNFSVGTLITAEGCYYSANGQFILGNEGKEILAFTGLKSFEGTLVIPDTVKTIPQSTLNGGKFTKVVLPSSLTSVAQYAFRDCAALKEIEINCNLTNTYAFYNCTNLEKVVVNEGVTSLASNSFRGDTKLETVELPASLTNINAYAFSGCSGLKNIILAEGSAYTVQDDFVVKGNEIALVAKGALEGEVVIPEGITKIANSAFSAAGKITSVKLPDSLEIIGEDVFFNCPNLKNITFGTAGKLTSIGAYAFQTTALESIVIPEGVTTIGMYAFGDNSSLKSVSFPSSLTSVGTKLFYNCRGLEEMTFPFSVSEQTFYNCTSLKTVTIQEGATSIGKNAFQNCSSLETVYIPKTVTSIDSTAFDGCSSLKNLVFEEGSSIQYADGMIIINNVVVMAPAVSGDVVVPAGVTSIGNKAFYKKKLNSISLPSTLTTIQDYAFNYTEVDEVIIPESVTSIGNRAFYYSTIKKVTVPATVTSVGSYAFAYCKSLEEATINSTAAISSNEFNNDIALKNVILPEGLTTIDMYAFYGCKLITSIVLPSTLTTIGEAAFRGCLALNNINIPDTVTSIGSQAFYQTGITSFTFPVGVKTVNDWMFANTSSIRVIDIKGAETVNMMYAYYAEILYLPKSVTKVVENISNCRYKVIFYEGSEEEWNAITGINNLKANLGVNSNKAKATVVVYNYNGVSNGNTVNITKQPKGGNYTQGLRTPTLSVETDAAEDALVLYKWYVDGKLEGKYTNMASINPDSNLVGEHEYKCEVIVVKDGKYTIATTETAKINIKAQEGSYFKGEGTEENPFILETTEDIDNLSALVNTGNNFKGQYFKLAADITLPTNWEPIGCTKDGTNNISSGANMNAFSGILDGAGYSVTVPAGEKPLFAYVYGASIKNLNIYGEQINGYGLINNMEGVGLSGTAVIVDNVTIKSGTKTLKAGILGGVITTNGYSGTSAGYESIIKNCTVEEGVVIGYDGTQSIIGSFAGRFQGTIENCVSYGTVKGTDYVGGIIGGRDNAMGTTAVKNCQFYGSVEATGNNVGGISGGIYFNSTAPNGIKVTIQDCTVAGTVSGKKNVGGILGGDEFTAQAWNEYHFTNNTFTGKVTGEENVGAIIGYYDSLNMWDDIAGNKYDIYCGATKAIAAVKYVDTSYENPTEVEGTLYFSTENGTSDCPTVTGCGWKAQHNRTDDPLGADADKLAYSYDAVKEARNGFETEDNYTVYYVKGEKVEGWKEIEGKVYYFLPGTGAMNTKKARTVAGVKYMFNSDGTLVSGTWYKHRNGMRYYYAGVQAFGWNEIDGKTYYFNEKGYMVTGEVEIDGVKYNFDEDGVFIGKAAAVTTGWTTEGKDSFYLEDGVKVEGWKEIEGAWYYFLPDSGALNVKAKRTINGVAYSFDTTTHAALNNGGVWYSHRNGMRYYLRGEQFKNGEYVIDGETYMFNAKGYLMTRYQIAE